MHVVGEAVVAKRWCGCGDGAMRRRGGGGGVVAADGGGGYRGGSVRAVTQFVEAVMSGRLVQNARA